MFYGTVLLVIYNTYHYYLYCAFVIPVDTFSVDVFDQFIIEDNFFEYVYEHEFAPTEKTQECKQRWDDYLEETGRRRRENEEIEYKAYLVGLLILVIIVFDNKPRHW